MDVQYEGPAVGKFASSIRNLAHRWARFLDYCRRDAAWALREDVSRI
jgi:hypothetical protein